MCIRDSIVTGDGRFGVYYVEGGANQLPSRVAYDRAWSAIAMAKPGDIDWDKAFAGVEWFHITGITPAISESAMELSLESVKEAKKRGITVSCDLNYRKNLWKYGKKASEVMREMAKMCIRDRIETFLEYMKYLRSLGKTLILISHKLDEIFAVCDDVTVLRDGAVVARHSIADITVDQLIKEMVNRSSQKLEIVKKGTVSDEIVLQVKNLACQSMVKDVSFSLRKMCIRDSLSPVRSSVIYFSIKTASLMFCIIIIAKRK